MSTLLDRGVVWMDLYVAEEYTDSRGNPGLHAPADVPVRVRVNTSVDRGSIAEVTGEVEVPAIRVIGRNLPLSSYDRVVFDGFRWDMATPPRQTPGLTRATRHAQFTVRGRNQPAYTIWGDDDPFAETFKEMRPRG